MAVVLVPLLAVRGLGTTDMARLCSMMMTLMMMLVMVVGTVCHISSASPDVIIGSPDVQFQGKKVFCGGEVRASRGK